MSDATPPVPAAWDVSWIEPVEARRHARGASTGLPPRRRVHDRRSGRVRAPARHRARRLRGVPQRHPRRRPRADARLHRVPQAAPGADLRRHRSRRRRAQRARCAAERRLVARPARHRPRDRRLRHRRRRSSPSCTSRSRPATTVRVRHRRDRGDRRRATSSRADLIARRGARPPPPRRRLGRARHRPIGWDAVRVADHGYDELVRRRSDRPSGASRSSRPCRSRELAPGRHVVDFGQNSNGWIRLDDLGPAGTELTITYGEWLDPDGDVTQDATSSTPRSRRRASPRCRSRPTSSSPAGDGSVFEPRHSTKGFQYVRIEGHPGPLDPATITSVVVHTDLAPHRRVRRAPTSASTGSTASRSGASAATPATSPPTAPPASAPGGPATGRSTSRPPRTSTTSATSRRSGCATSPPSSSTDGAVTNIVPDPSPATTAADSGRDRPGLGGMGRRRRARAVGALPRDRPHRRARRPVRLDDGAGSTSPPAAPRSGAIRHASNATPNPLPHERYLWDSGWHFGEWLEPGDDHRTRVRASSSSTTTARSPPPTSTAPPTQLAEHRRRPRRPRRRREHYARARRPTSLDAWRTEFIDDDGTRPARHPGQPRPRPRVRPRPRRARASTAAADLVALIRAAGNHLGTGFLATPFLLPVLADHGHLDVAYELLFQDTEPSWLAHESTAAHDDLGGLGRRRRRRHRRPLAQPLQQGRGHLLPAPLRRRPPARRARLPPLPRRATTRRRDHRAHAPTTTPRTDASRSPGSLDRRRGPPRRHGPGRHRSRARCCPTAPSTSSARAPTGGVGARPDRAPGPASSVGAEQRGGWGAGRRARGRTATSSAMTNVATAMPTSPRAGIEPPRGTPTFAAAARHR